MQRPTPHRGEIWLAYIPGQPGDPHQPRPALVVSEDIRNRMTDDIIVIAIFSRGRLGPTRVPIDQGIGGLAHDSVLFCEEISTVTYDFVDRGPLGSLVPAALLEQVVRAVRRAVGESVPEPE